MEKDLELSQFDCQDFLRESEVKKEKKLCDKLVETFRRRIFIVNWLPKYNKTNAIGDFIAGVTIGMTMIPQSLAYANLANVEPVYGLYSSFMGAIVYIFLGTVKEVSIGPTSLMSIITVSYTYEKPIEYVFIMTFVCGCVEILMGIFRLGFLVDFISVPVVSAFSSSTAFIIIIAQIKNLLGIQFKAKSLPSTLWNLFTNLNQIKISDTILGICAIAFLLSLKNVSAYTRAPNLKKFLFYLGLSRNALLVIITSLIAFFISNSGAEVPFMISEKVQKGLPVFKFPKFSANVENKTINFVEISSDIGSGFILLPLVSILANVAIAKSFSSGKVVDTTQEMIALGVCNVFGSFFQSIPTTGAFTRSAVSSASGVQSPMAGVYCASMALLALTLLTPYFHYIPKSTLAAILICAVLSLIDLQIARKLWNKSKIDFISWIGCIVTCITAGVEVGLLIGIILSISNIFLKAARPGVVIFIKENKESRFIYVRPSTGIFFPGIDYIREQIGNALIKTDFRYSVVIDLIKISTIDFTSLHGFEALSKDLKKYNLEMSFINMEEKLQKRLTF